MRRDVVRQCFEIAQPMWMDPAELTVAQVILVDETIVFHLMSHRKVLCQVDVPHMLKVRIQVVGGTLPSRCRRQISLARYCASGAARKRGAKTAPLLERFPLGAATTVTPAWTGPWLKLDLGPARHRKCDVTEVPSRFGHLS